MVFLPGVFLHIVAVGAGGRRNTKSQSNRWHRRLACAGAG